jgi:hypothetical protein
MVGHAGQGSGALSQPFVSTLDTLACIQIESSVGGVGEGSR